MISSPHGALFVIDGMDGSGKATQTKRLCDRLRAEGFAVETLSFPRYGQKSCGPVEEYLGGKYGRAHEVTAHAASVLFAVDRFDASFQIREWLAAGVVVVADRYVVSNMGHQGGKMNDPEARRAYLAWNDHLEHEVLGIPRPTLNIILRVPPSIAEGLARQGAQEKTKVAGDIHESDHGHLVRAHETYQDIAATVPQCVCVDCAPDGHLLCVEDIHERIWQHIHAHLPVSSIDHSPLLATV